MLLCTFNHVVDNRRTAAAFFLIFSSNKFPDYGSENDLTVLEYLNSLLYYTLLFVSVHT